MKKELEVLQAAEAGNVAKLEALFEQRQSKVLAGLFKGPNINWRNENGCTALHLAALNGHPEAVIFLLHNDASANTPDNAGIWRYCKPKIVKRGRDLGQLAMNVSLLPDCGTDVSS